MSKHNILLLGLKDTAVVQNCFQKTSHHLTAVPALPERFDSLNIPEFTIVYLQPADDSRAIQELLQIQKLAPDAAVVLVCSQPSASLTLEAWRKGAADILFLPFAPESLEESLERAESRLRDRRSMTEKDMPARVRYRDDTGKERWIAIVPPKLTIGRSSTSDLVLAKMNVSRAHAEVLVEDGNYILRDLGSKHGTFVNGIKVDETVLSHGDRIRLGGLQGQTVTFHKGDLLQSLLSGTGSRTDSGLSVHGFREMGMLLSTFHALSSIPLLDDLLNLVVDTAIELTDAERGFIMLKEADNKPHFRCARNAQKQPLDGSSFQTSRRVPEEAFQTGRRIVINDLDLDGASDEHSSTRRLGVRSISCVPLRYLPLRDSGALSGIGTIETIGVLYVDSANIGGGLSNSQIEALDTLASEAAMAIYNARLYKESQAKRKMDEELAIAREIQQALLPAGDKTLPFVSACSINIPCHEVGGDYFDYFEIENGRFGFAVGDVAGKGMPAALLAAMLQGIFCAQTLLDLPLPSMIANVNCSLARRGTGRRFVTFFFGLLDADGKLTYTNAGHNPPIMVRPDGSMCELTDGGMVLGLFPNATYEARTIQLAPGDHLVLFTDGLLEARNVAGQEFGEDRLRNLLPKVAKDSASKIMHLIREELVSFSTMAPQHDDITLMVLGYREPPPQAAG